MANEFLKYACPIETDLIDKETISNILPEWHTIITKVEQTDEEEPKLQLNLLVQANTESEALQWVKDFEDKTYCTYAIRTTYRPSGSNLFRQLRNCHRNTKCQRIYDPTIKGINTRNTNCPSKISITVRRVIKNSRGTPGLKDNPSYRCVVQLIFSHNHPTSTAEALQFRPMSEELRAELVELFKCGYSPVNALETIRERIKLTYKNYEEVMADRSHCPDYDDCYHVYRKVMSNDYGPLYFDKDGKIFLHKKLEQLNTLNNDPDTARMIIDEDDYVLCICTPLMKRIHANIKYAADVVLVDSTQNIGKPGGRIFLLLTHSACGGLPLGIIITSSDTPEVITTGLELFKEMMGTTIFNGSPDGPTVFLTNGSAAEREAIRAVWPESIRLLCSFHVVETVMKWLTDEQQHNIPKDQQFTFLDDFRNILYAATKAECESSYEIAIDKAELFPKYQEYLDGFWSKRKSWALSYRPNANSYCEASMRLLKEKVFHRIKANNTAQLVEFLTTTFEDYYKLRLLDAAKGDEKSESQVPSVVLKKIRFLKRHILLVPSEDVTSNIYYRVNMESLTCSCSDGNAGDICKHVDWACGATITATNESEDTVVDDSEVVKSTFYTIATGMKESRVTAEELPPLPPLVPLSMKPILPMLPLSSTSVPSDEVMVESEDQEEEDSISEGDTDLEEAARLLEEMQDILAPIAQEMPDELVPALTLFNARLKSFSSTERMLSALTAFGQDDDENERRRPKNKRYQ